MGLKAMLKKHEGLHRAAENAVCGYYCGLTCLSPRWNVQARYRQATGRRLDLKKPQTLVEKLLWLKLNRYTKDPLVIRCADKYAVRDYVKDRGCPELLNQLLGAWDRVEDIPWEQLPGKFVLKWNFGAGMNLICRDKASLDIPKAKRTLKKWKRKKVWLPHAELQYKYAPKKLICETFLEDPPGDLPDYKVYCFHGVPQAILVMHERGKELKTEFFDPEWNPLENTAKYKTVETPSPAPGCLSQMMEAARILSEPFPFVRCDFYVASGRLYFGELTFTPAGGLYLSQTPIHGKDMTDFLHIP